MRENNQTLGLVDPKLRDFDKDEATRLIGVALMCTQASPTMRPPMSRVVAMLAGDAAISSAMTKPSYLTDWDFQDITGSFLSEDVETPSSSSKEAKRSYRKDDDERGNATSPSAGVDPLLSSPIHVSETMIRDVIGEYGR